MMNIPTIVAPTLAPLQGPSGPFQLASGGDRARQAIQSYLYFTQFYKGRTDGQADDERMDAAIKLVQIAAHIPVTGVFDDGVRDAIVRFRQTQSFRAKEPSSASQPETVSAPPPVAAMPPPQRSFVRDLATFAILTSPAWGLLLYIKRPWTKLPWAKKLRIGGRAR